MYRALPKPTSIWAVMVVRVVLTAGFLAGALRTGFAAATPEEAAAAAFVGFVFLVVAFFIGEP
jgi:glycerol uptake facilitator-like aquaporin